jgi:hypothetical protein
MGQKPSKSVYGHKSDNASKCLISKHVSIIIKTGKTLGRVAHNLKVTGSNPVPATKLSFHIKNLDSPFGAVFVCTSPTFDIWKHCGSKRAKTGA